MQSAPTEASQTATSVESSNNVSPIHHGQPDLQHQASDSLPREDVGELPVDRPDDTDALSVSSGDTSRGRRSNTGRISSSRHGSSQESSPGSRIDEYERANATIRRPSNGMIFQVIRNSGDSNVSIQEFPNGTLLASQV